MRIILRVGKKLHITPSAILIILFAIVEIGAYLLRMPYLHRNIALMVIGAISILYCISKRGLVTNSPFIVFVLIYTIFGVLSFSINRNADIQELLWPIAYMGVGLLLLNYQIPFNIARNMYYVVCSAFAVSIILYGGVDNLILRSSRNTISTYVLLFWAIYMISLYNSSKPIPFVSILVGLFVCVIAIGRSGVLTFSIITLLFILYGFLNKNNRSFHIFRGVFYIVILVVMASVAYGLYHSYINQMVQNLLWRGFESKRLLIWKEYFESMKKSVLYVLFGAPQYGSFWLDRYSDNLHNSFLELHAKYGLTMLVSVLLLLLKNIKLLYKRRNVHLLLPFIGLLIRMNFDYTNFNAMLDVVLIYFLLFPIYLKRDDTING